jgi:hypothetical protein
MDSRRTLEEPLSPDAADFVRFCYRRRPVCWPELYDEMCAVAGRGLFRGWGAAELAEHGVGFSLFESAALAALVRRIVAEEQEARARSRAAVTVGAARGTNRRHDDRIEPEERAVEAFRSLARAAAG